MAFVFSHGDITELSMDEKQRLMSLWNENKEAFKKRMLPSLILLFACVCFAVIGNFLAVLCFIPLLILIFSYALIDEDKRIGYILLLICLIPFYVMQIIAGGGVIGCLFLVAGVYNLLPVFCLIKGLCNYKTYHALSKEKGFPTFFPGGQTEVFAEQIYMRDTKTPPAAAENASNKPAWDPFAYLSDPDDAEPERAGTKPEEKKEEKENE